MTILMTSPAASVLNPSPDRRQSGTALCGQASRIPRATWAVTHARPLRSPSGPHRFYVDGFLPLPGLDVHPANAYRC